MYVCLSAPQTQRTAITRAYQKKVGRYWDTYVGRKKRVKVCLVGKREVKWAQKA